jgi:hypothetical protein
MPRERPADDLGCARELGLLLRLARAHRRRRHGPDAVFDLDLMEEHWRDMLRSLRATSRRRGRVTARTRVEPDFKALVRTVRDSYAATETAVLALADHPFADALPSMVADVAALKDGRDRYTAMLAAGEKRPAENRLRAAFTLSVERATGGPQDAHVAACLSAALDREIDAHAQGHWRRQHAQALGWAKNAAVNEAMFGLRRAVADRHRQRR